MSKKLLGIVVLGLLFISAPSKADDISDFEIEGMSVGDSLLDYFSESDIKKNNKNYLKNNKYTSVGFTNVGQTYHKLEFAFLSTDKNYKLAGISGINLYEFNFQDCIAKKKEISTSIEDLFKNELESNLVERIDKEMKHTAYPSGNSMAYLSAFSFLKSKDIVVIACINFSEKDTDHIDHLRVDIYTSSYDYFLTYEAYK